MLQLHSQPTNSFNQSSAGDNSLAMDKTAMITTYVSYLNDCFFGKNGQPSTNWHNTADVFMISQAVKENKAGTMATKLKAIISIATKYAQSLGANESDIQNTIQVATVYCMYNRCVQQVA